MGRVRGTNQDGEALGNHQEWGADATPRVEGVREGNSITGAFESWLHGGGVPPWELSSWRGADTTRDRIPTQRKSKEEIPWLFLLPLRVPAAVSHWPTQLDASWPWRLADGSV